ncbi:MAG: hypothetical protein CFH43_00568 [Proteobacteria bacterium]|nr:MAG: hypothetical protein CFH43_00568 [Pseudomonadota bacterium]
MKLVAHLLLQVIFFIGLAAGGFFIFQNTHKISINIAAQVFENVPVWLALLLAFTLGFTVALGLFMNIKLNKKIR